VIIFGVDEPGRGIMRVSADGREPVTVTRAISEVSHGAIRHDFPTFLPDGKHFLFRHNGPPDGIYIASIDATPEQQPVRLVQSDANYFSYVPADSHHGQILFTREGILRAQQFDPESRQLIGDSVPIIESVYPVDNVSWGLFSVSNTGVLVHTSASGSRVLTWVDRNGDVVDNLGQSGQMVALSPDATQVAFNRPVGPRNQAIWLMDLMTRRTTQLTFRREMNPVWSWDGHRVAFVSYPDDGSGFNVHQISSNGAGQDEALVEFVQSLPTDWWRDYLLYHRRMPKTKADLWVRDMRNGKDFPVLATAVEETRGKFSPDGKSIAFVSDQTGRNEIWVAPFTVSSNGEPVPSETRRKVSDNGGIAVRWRRDGKELFYLSSDGWIMAVDTTPGSTFPYGTPHRLFQTPTGPWEWDVAPDGKRFLIPTVTDALQIRVIAVLNWMSLLKK
jgi:Tol biopolymer transport system component